ncbi:MAG: hypothetical protein KBF82_01110, partial [Chitinophagaceae bacterium]|nr:hypothetical protein [Chitinophagaceae bacterium]
MRKIILLLTLLFSIFFDLYSQENEWTWMKGDDNPVVVDSSQPVYGPLGASSSNYRPGIRSNATMWAAADGSIWLFGGLGSSDGYNNGYLNDLWKYNPATNEWTWVKGDNTINNIGIYSDVNASFNKPGARDQAVGWVDTNGDFWLFGGNGYAGAGSGLLNDLWKYNIASNTWTWVKGDNIINVTGVYSNGTVLLNKPGSRYQATGWVAGGDLYLFSGWGRANTATNGRLNDLWRYTIATNTWTWVKGDNTISNVGVYTSATASNRKPGARYQATSWVDASGIAWLFGGSGQTTSSSTGNLNDLWSYNATTNIWTWVKGDNVLNVDNVYGVQNIPDINNKPGGRYSSAGWADNTGNLWLFAGNRNSTFPYDFNDMWRYNIATNTWTWIKGSDTWYQPANYGTQGIADDNNTPGSKKFVAVCKDASGSFWLYGGVGYGFVSNSNAVFLNELWKFNPVTNQWTWVRHNNLIETYYPSLYNQQGVPNLSSKPGGKNFATYCSDNNGNYWLFGGNSNTGTGNDLWKYTESNNIWTWMKGDSTTNRIGIYGTLNQPNINNKPGSRSGAVMWKGGPDELWLFGGYGYGNSVEGNLNDLWKYTISTNTWTWVKGDSSIDNSGIYNQTPIQNKPGGRSGEANWKDNNGTIWLFGGVGFSDSGNGQLNDLWKYDITTNTWTWVKGNTTSDNNGEYGTQGIADQNNKPGSRNSASTWTDGNNNLWLFGGNGFDESTSYQDLNDLWKYNIITNEWTWVKGNKNGNIYGSYGTIEIPGNNNKPGSRHGSVSWADGVGNLWLFGGNGYDSNSGDVELSDLWKYNIISNQWTWIKGYETGLGEYGTMGVPDNNNKPGGRRNVASWKANGNQLWLFGGFGYATTFPGDILNDLWRYQLPCPGEILLSPVSGVICFDGNPVTLTASGGTSYVWYKDGAIITGENGSTYTATSFGSYYVTGNVGSCTGKYSNEVLLQSPSIAPSLGGTGVYCLGDNVNVGIPETQNEQDYTWLGPQFKYVPIGGGGGNQSLNFTMLSPSQAGTYIVESTKPGCDTVYSNYVFVGFAEINGLTITNLCPTTPGSAEVTFSWDPIGPTQLLQLFEYSVTNNPTPPATGTITSSFSITRNIGAGLTFFIHIRARCGSGNFGFTDWVTMSFVSPSAAPVLSVTPATANICQGGSQLLTVSGNGAYQWMLDGTPISGATSSTYSAIAAGSYSVTTTINGCSNTYTSNNSVITVTALPTGTISPATASICSGGSQLLTATGGTSYQWYKDGILISGEVNATYSATLAGTYTVTIFNGTCSGPASNSSVITVGTTPTGTISPGTASICSGGSQLLTATGGTSYQWYKDGILISGEVNATYSATLAGTYTVIIFNGTCSGPASNSSVITVGTTPTGTISPGTASICSGGSQLLTATGGTSYQWYKDGILISGAVNATYSATLAGTYTVTIFNGTCSGPASNSSVITVGTTPTGTISPATASICSGGSQLLTATGGTSYQWYKDGILISGEVNATYSATLAGTYTVTIFNGTCSGPASNSSVITVGTTPTGTISPGTASICSGGSQLLTATGGTSYQWYKDGILISGAVNATYSATLAGTYTVTIFNGSCSGPASNNSVITVGTTPTGTISPASASICSGGSQLLTATGGTSYQWYKDGILISGAVNATYSATLAGTYTVTIFNGSCSGPASNSSVITVGTTPTGTISPASASICSGGSQLLTATGGTSYQWYKDGVLISGAVNATYSATLAGTYTVIIFNGTCSGPASNTATVIVNPTLTSTTNIAICTNQLPFVWNGNSYITAGTYNVTLIGTTGCDSIATLNLSFNPTLTSTTNIAICTNQLPYTWNGNNYTAAGTYNVTLIGTAGCDSIATLNLSVNPILTSTTNISVCNNQLPYVWNGNNYTAAGTYNVTLIGTAGCDSIATLNLSVNPILTSTTNISVC